MSIFFCLIGNFVSYPHAPSGTCKDSNITKKTLIVDVDSWTVDIMLVVNKAPDESNCITIPKGLITCMRSINEQCVRQLNGELDEADIQQTKEIIEKANRMR